MTLTETATVGTSVDYLQRARSIAAVLESQAEPSEAATDVTPEAHQAMVDQELYWMFVPRSYGGGEVDIVSGLKVLEEVSRADGSIGWVLMAASIGTRNASFFLPKEGRDELFGGENKAICAGFAAPLGKGVEVTGGMFGGAPRLHFGSGSTWTTHLAVTCRVFDEAGNQLTLDGTAPDIRTVFMPIEKITILGNWDVMGLKATGSYDYALTPDQFMPEKYTLRSAFWTDPTLGVKSDVLPRGSIGFAGHVGVVLGIMKRALEEVARIVDGKSRQGYDVPVANHAVFKKAFSEADAKYHAVREYAFSVFREVEDSARNTGQVSAQSIARARQVTTWVHDVGTEVVNFAHLWGGTTTIRNPSALGRLSRDMAVARNHLAADPIGLVDSAGPILAAWQNGEIRA